MSTTTHFSRARIMVYRAALAGLLGLVLLWLLEIASALSLPGLARGVAIFTLVGAMAALLLHLGPPLKALVLGTSAHHPRHQSRRQARRRLLLPALLLLAVTVRWIGIEHEVEERAYRDEGTYYHHAAEINDGEPLRYSFVYPHFLYYADAFILWLTGLFPTAWAWLCAAFFGVTEPLGTQWLALRLGAAALSAAAVAPVAFAARVIASPIGHGRLAGLIAALLYIASPLANEAAHLNISDGPSGSWAAFCFGACAWIAVRERRGPYLRAGLFSGLAAATKYPAGTVAVAVVAAWFAHRWRAAVGSEVLRGGLRGVLRSSRPGLLVAAGAASLGAFLLSMPSLLIYPQQALFGGRGIFFGLRQYGGAGWIGVMPESKASFYLGHLSASFSPAVMAVGGLGLLALLLRPTTLLAPREPQRPPRAVGRARRARFRLLALLPFPLLYLALLVSMNMVVRRNLYPAVPALAALLGAGLVLLLAALLHRWAKAEGRRRLGAIALPLILASFLWSPVQATWTQAAGFAHPSTRQVARQWLMEHLPPGATVVQEAYTPRLDPGRFTTVRHRFVGRMSQEELQRPEHDVVMLSWNAYGRFLDPDNLREPHHQRYAARYREILSTFPKLWEITPGPTRRGPAITVYRVPAASSLPASEPLVVPAHQLFVPDGSMRAEGPGQPVRYTRPGQWALVTARLPPGRYQVALRGELQGPASLRLRLFSPIAGEAPPPTTEFDRQDFQSVEAGPTRFAITVPAGGEDLPTAYLYLYLEEGSALRAVQIRPLPPRDEGDEEPPNAGSPDLEASTEEASSETRSSRN